MNTPTPKTLQYKELYKRLQPFASRMHAMAVSKGYDGIEDAILAAQDISQAGAQKQTTELLEKVSKKVRP